MEYLGVFLSVHGAFVGVNELIQLGEGGKIRGTRAAGGVVGGMSDEVDYLSPPPPTPRPPLLSELETHKDGGNAAGTHMHRHKKWLQMTVIGPSPSLSPPSPPLAWRSPDTPPSHLSTSYPPLATRRQPSTPSRNTGSRRQDSVAIQRKEALLPMCV